MAHSCRPGIIRLVRPADFDYPLPPELIAQTPLAQRESSRLMVVDRASGSIADRVFRELPDLLRPDDLLVLNDSRVIPARLRGRKPTSHGRVEVMLAEEIQPGEWWVMLRPGRRAGPGTRLTLTGPDGTDSSLAVVVREKSADGLYRATFEGTSDLLADLDQLGEVPLPPYIRRASTGPTPADRERYQTVFARHQGSLAAPTAGLHFTKALLNEIRARGVEIQTVTLHVGLGTFAPIKTPRLEDHRLHFEPFTLPGPTAEALNLARASGRRVVAAGTTVVRLLEHLAQAGEGRLTPGSGTTQLFIHPAFRFRVVDALITNFHLPQSTLLMLVCAFGHPAGLAGRELILRAYAEAVARRYRFFSYGDAMFVQ